MFSVILLFGFRSIVDSRIPWRRFLYKPKLLRVWGLISSISNSLILLILNNGFSGTESNVWLMNVFKIGYIIAIVVCSVQEGEKLCQPMPFILNWNDI